MEFMGRDAHQNSPSQHSEAMQVSGYTENTPWHAHNPPAQHGDPRLRPAVGPLYGKSAVQYGQPMMTTQPAETAITQPGTWTTGSEASAPPRSGTAPQAAVTPGLCNVTVVDSIVFSLVVIVEE